MKHIAVDKDLTPIRTYLESKGYTVESFEGSAKNAYKDHHNLDAVVVSGLNENLLGIENAEFKAMIIDARGKTPEEVEQQIEKFE